MDPEQPIYNSDHRIDKSRIAFEKDELGRRIEAELGTESSTRDHIMNGNRSEMMRN